MDEDTARSYGEYVLRQLGDGWRLDVSRNGGAWLMEWTNGAVVFQYWTPPRADGWPPPDRHLALHPITMFTRVGDA